MISYFNYAKTKKGAYRILAITQYKDPVSITIEYTNGGIFEFSELQATVYDEILTAKNPMQYIFAHSTEFANYVCIRPAIIHHVDINSEL